MFIECQCQTRRMFNLRRVVCIFVSGCEVWATVECREYDEDVVLAEYDTPEEARQCYDSLATQLFSEGQLVFARRQDDANEVSGANS